MKKYSPYYTAEFYLFLSNILSCANKIVRGILNTKGGVDMRKLRIGLFLQQSDSQAIRHLAPCVA